jgi:toxin ParE1/3/4
VRVVFAPAAQTDLIELGERSSRDAAGESPLVNALIDQCYGLTDHPERCPLVPRYEAHGIRRLVARQYLIFYRVRGEEIQVVRVLYGGRDWQALLFPEE